MKNTRSVLSGLLSVGLILVANSGHAAPGSLDPTFGKGGKVQTNFGNSIVPLAAALQSDGKVVVVGTLNNFQIATQVLAVVRYLPNGSLDKQFGNGGLAITAFTNFINMANAVAIQPDGKIVAVGEVRSADGTLDEFLLARFNSNGSLDQSFGTGGQVTTDFLNVHSGGFHQAANVVILQHDGQILVGGIASPSPKRPTNTALARYNPNGSLDTTFGNGGEVAVVVIGEVNALALLSDGGILALNNTGGIAQFKANGSLATAVTGGTIVATTHTSITGFQPDGRFLQIGTIGGSYGRRDVDVVVRRFQPTGGPDQSFKSPAFDFGATGPFTNIGQAFEVQSDGKIVVGGLSQTTSFGDIFGVARLNPDGSLDFGFGSGGVLTTQFQGSDQATAVLVQPDGKILAIGQTLEPGTGLADMAIARYLRQ